MTDRQQLQKGMHVSVWGRGIPFSLDTRAEKIVVMQKP